MKLMNMIKEMKTQTYDYGCLMIYYDFPQMKFLSKMLEPNDIYTENGDDYGIEDEPHVTLLYGFHKEVKISDLGGILKKHRFGRCEIYNPSLFKNDTYDVLKFDVNEPTLVKVNSEVSTFPHTTNYPNYHPHLTIAYIKSGFGSKYIRKLGNIKYTLTPLYAVYSEPNGKKTKIPINFP
jgi:hypothetical protein